MLIMLKPGVRLQFSTPYRQFIMSAQVYNSTLSFSRLLWLQYFPLMLTKWKLSTLLWTRKFVAKFVAKMKSRKPTKRKIWSVFSTEGILLLGLFHLQSCLSNGYFVSWNFKFQEVVGKIWSLWRFRLVISRLNSGIRNRHNFLVRAFFFASNFGNCVGDALMCWCFPFKIG